MLHGSSGPRPEPAAGEPAGTTGTEDVDPATGRGRLPVLLILAAAAVYLLVELLAPFLPALVTSAVLAVLVYPAYARLETWVTRRRTWLGHRNVAAFTGTVAVFFLILIPLVGLSLVLAQEVARSAEWAVREAGRMLGPEGTLRDWVRAAGEFIGIDGAQLRASVTEQLEGGVSTLTARTLGFLSGLGGWLLQAGVALFSLFYLLRDADGIVRAVRWLVPLEKDETARLFRRSRDVIYATVYGNVVVAAVQGVLGGLAFWLVGLPAAVLWGTVMGVLSLLPVVSAPLVWGPAGAYLLATGRTLGGIFLIGFGALVIGTVDNYLRAIIVSERAQLHPLAVFLSVLGGLFLFGAAGLFLGPVLFVVALSLLEMARLALDADGPAALSPDGPPGLLTGEPRTPTSGGEP